MWTLSSLRTTSYEQAGTQLHTWIIPNHDFELETLLADISHMIYLDQYTEYMRLALLEITAKLTDIHTPQDSAF